MALSEHHYFHHPAFASFHFHSEGVFLHHYIHHLHVREKQASFSKLQGLYVKAMNNECSAIGCVPPSFNGTLGDGRRVRGHRGDIELDIVNMEEALGFLEESIQPPEMDYLVSILERCIKIKDLNYAKRLYLKIYEYGLDCYVFVGNFLVRLFVECRDLSIAIQIFGRLPDQDEVSWASVMKGLIECGESSQALSFYARMEYEQVSVGKQSYLSALRACSKLQYMEQGREIHSNIVKEGLDKDIYVSNCLVDLYAKCGFLIEAHYMFEKLSVRDAVSWNSLMIGYIEDGSYDECLKCLNYMQIEGVYPNVVSFLCCLKACHNVNAVLRVLEIHKDIVQEGFENNTFLASTLVDIYAKFGLLEEAHEVFDELSVQDVISWTSLLLGYLDHGFYENALHYFDKMKSAVSPNAITYMCALKACGNLKLLNKGQAIHLEIVKGEFDQDSIVCNSLVDMYVKCGALIDAQDTFDTQSSREVVSWTTLITAYVECGLSIEVLNTLESMRLEKVCPNDVTYISIIGACSDLRAMRKGQELHLRITKEGYEKGSVMGNSLMDMYARCGCIAEVEYEFNKLSEKDLISWSALIAGYAEVGHCEEALNALNCMQANGIIPDAITFISILKACTSRQAVENGLEIHAEIIKEEFETDAFIGNKLVDFYAKCGMLLDARDVFDGLEIKDSISWNSLLTGYSEHIVDDKSGIFFDTRHSEDFDYVTSICNLKFCGKISDLNKGQYIHALIIKGGLEKDIFMANSLIDMYANCGALSEAHAVFRKMHRKDVMSWNVLVAGFADQGFFQEALDYIGYMQIDGLNPDANTYISMLKACQNSGNIYKGQEIHSEIAKDGFEKDAMVGNAVIDMYSKCGALIEARAVFEELPCQDVISWNTLINGYAKHGAADEALLCLEQMEMMGMSFDAITYSSSFNACGRLGEICRGQALHAKATEDGFDSNGIVGNSLVDMYVKCGMITEARAVFDELPLRDTVSWNVLAAGYVLYGYDKEVFNCLEHMQVEGILLDAASFVWALKACSSPEFINVGWEIHAEIVKEGFETDLYVSTALISMYVKCGFITEARELFDELLLVEDVVVWTTVIFGYAEHDQSEMAGQLFLQMLEQGLLPNMMSFAGILKACGNMGDLQAGKKFHAQICILNAGPIAISALIEMYGKCGKMFEAQEIFDSTQTRGLIEWTALISGYARNGECDRVFELFEKMRKEDLHPDEITFINILSVCCHMGLVNHGRRYFDSMKKYNLTPSIKHYNCMIDLFGRAGQIDEAILTLKMMPLKPDNITWSTFVDACRKWGKTDLAKEAFLNMNVLNATDAGSYVLMRNLYADVHV